MALSSPWCGQGDTATRGVSWVWCLVCVQAAVQSFAGMRATCYKSSESCLSGAIREAFSAVIYKSNLLCFPGLII